MTAASAEMPGRRALTEKSRLWESKCVPISIIDLRNVECAVEGLQFGAVQLGESRKQFLAGFLQVNFDLAAVGLAGLALDEIERLAARHQRHDAVMLRLQAFRELADGGPLAAGVALHVQEQQILQRRNAFALCGLLGEALEAAHLIAEFG